MKNNDIEKSAVNVLIRIIIFLVYYVGLIAFGGLLIYFTYLASVWFWVDLIPEIDSGRLIIFLIVCWAGVCCMALMFAIFLIKPLFSIEKNTNEERVEVTKQDCPKLFEAIEDIVRKVGTKMPKHVYITTDVNACVFYDQSIWAIFFPVSKNLEVGTGLLEGTSEMELKAILAHEFGHFSQNSMKIGSTVYVVGSIIDNLLNKRDAWDEWMEKWINSDWGIFTIFGGLTCWMANLVNRMNLAVYKHIAISNAVLSRHMEYDADNVACSYAGSENVISAFRKIEILAESSANYRQCLQSLLSRKEIVSSFYTSQKIFEDTFPKNKPSFDYKTHFTDVESIDDLPTKHLRVVNLLDSHPSTEDRIENAKHQDVKIPEAEVVPSKNLFPKEVLDNVGRHYLFTISENTDNVKSIDDVEFESLLKTIYVAPEICSTFFEREIANFELDEIKAGKTDVNPFTKENEQIIKQYILTGNELAYMRQIQSMDDTDHIEVYYNGSLVSTDNLPTDLQMSEVNSLQSKVIKIYKDTFGYLYHHADETDKAQLEDLYKLKWYAQNLLNDNDMNKFIKLKNARIELHNELVSNSKPDEETFAIMRLHYITFGRMLSNFIKSLSHRALAYIMNDEDIKAWNEWQLVSDNSSINVDAVNQMFGMVDSLEQMFIDMTTKANTELEKIGEKFI